MNKHLIIYDGNCSFCRRSKNILSKLDWLQKFNWTPYQKLKTLKEFNLDTKDCEKELKLITRTKKLYGGSKAFTQIALRIPLLAPFAWLLLLPLFKEASQLTYQWIAKNRKHL